MAGGESEGTIRDEKRVRMSAIILWWGAGIYDS